MKKVFTIISVIFIIGFFVFGTNFDRRIFLVESGIIGNVNSLKFTTMNIIVDGILEEPCWELESHEFILKSAKETKTSDVPSFLFVQDRTNLYLGVKYKIMEGIPLEELNDEK